MLTESTASVSKCPNHVALGTYGSDAETLGRVLHFNELSDHAKLYGTTFRPKIKHVLKQFSSGALYLPLFM